MTHTRSIFKMIIIFCVFGQFVYAMDDEIASIQKKELWPWQKECRSLIELTNACTIIHDQSLNERNGVSAEYFQRTGELLQNKEITHENLRERRLSSRFIWIPNNAPEYTINYTFFHVLVLSKVTTVSAILAKENALKAYCNRFGDEAYKLLNLKDTSGRKLLHVMFEKGDKTSVSVLISVLKDCAKKKNMPLLVHEIVQEKESFSQCTPIDCAYYYDNIETSSELISSVASLDRNLANSLLEYLANKK